MRKPLLALSLSAGLLLGGTVAGTGAAAAPKAAPKAAASKPASHKTVHRAPFVVAGTVQAVDDVARTVTVSLPGGHSATMVVGGATVHVDGQAAVLSAVPTGARVTVSGVVAGGLRTVTRVAVVTTWAFGADGTVGEVDLAGSVVSVERSGSTLTVPVDPAAAVEVDGATAVLADVPVGARIRISGTVTNGVERATKLVVTTQWTFRLDGVVDGVDGEASTVTLTAGGAEHSVPVDGAAVVTVDGVPAGLGDVPAGARVRLTGVVTNGVLSAEALTVTTRWSFHLDGTVGAVDTAESTITVKRSPWSTVVNVDPAAVVTVNGARVGLAAVPAAATVRVSGTVVNSVATATRVTVTVPKPKPRRR